MKTIIVTAEEGLGDCVLMVPLVYNLRRVFPESHIFILSAGYNPVIFSEMDVDGYLFESDLLKQKRPRVDLFLDTHTGHKPRNLIAGTYVHFPLQKCRCDHDYEIPRGEKSTRKQYMDFLKVLGFNVRMNSDRAYALLPTAETNVTGDEVFSVCKTQFCSDDDYVKLFEKYVSSRRPIVTGASPREQKIAAMIAEKHEVTNLAGKLTIPQLICLVKNSRRVISFDSFAVHLADSFRKEITCFYKKIWNYKCYIPSITGKARVITFENVNELL